MTIATNNDKINRILEEILQDITTEASRREERKETEGQDSDTLYFYFDPLFGRPLGISPRLATLVDEQDNVSNEEITILLLERFPLHFSHKLRRSPSPAPFVTWELFEYERLLACMLDRLPVNPAIPQNPIVTRRSSAALTNIVTSMASDIFHALDNFTTPSLNNPLIALLLRCLSHAIRFRRRIVDSNADIALQGAEYESVSKVVGMGLLVAASFLPPSFFHDNDDAGPNLAPITHSATSLEAEQLLPSLSEQLSLSYAVTTYCDPRLHFGAHHSPFWDIPVIHIQHNALAVSWADSPVLRRCAASLLKTCCWNDILGGEMDKSLDKMPSERTSFNPLTSSDSFTVKLAQICRAHFFGRLFPSNITDSEISIVTQQQPTRIRHPSGVIISKLNDSDAPEESRRLSQLVAPLRIFSMLTNNTIPTTSLLVEMLPVVYALLDFWDGKYQTLGGALYLSLFRGGDQMKGFLLEKDDGLAEQILSRVILTCRDPVALTVLSMAHCKILLNKSYADRPRLQGACKVWMHKAKSTYFGPDTEIDHGRRMLPGLVVGAILPVLSHMATWNPENANAIEISREGLDLFLSTLRMYSPSHDFDTTESVRTVAALVALVTLLMGSWPIAKTYSEQIICSLLTVIGRAERLDPCSQKHPSTFETTGQQHKQRLAVLECTKHSASIALIICGEPGQQVLTVVENESTALTQACKEIRLQAQSLIKTIATVS
jgi:hypothetical protein